MRVLVDEGVPRQVADGLRSLGFDADRFPPAWRGIKNGVLLAAADQASFDVLLTNDKNIVDQNSLRVHRLAIVALPHNRRRPLMDRITDIADTLRRTTPRQCIVIGLDGDRIVSEVVAGRPVTSSLPPVAPFRF